MRKIYLSCLFLLSFVVMSFAQPSIVATPDWGVRVKITPSTYVITYRPSEFWVAADTLNDYVVLIMTVRSVTWSSFMTFMTTWRT